MEFGPLVHGVSADEDLPSDPPPDLLSALRQLREYFAGSRRTFDVSLDLSAATDFQRSVYDELLKVEYGRVVTYGELARRQGRPQGAQALGQAVGANPIPIIVPCHRVVAADGRLGGFSGGLDAKVALLRHEGVEVEGSRPTSRVHPEILRLDL